MNTAAYLACSQVYLTAACVPNIGGGCCMFSNAIQSAFSSEANTMNPYQTAPTGAV